MTYSQGYFTRNVRLWEEINWLEIFLELTANTYYMLLFKRYFFIFQQPSDGGETAPVDR